MEDSGDEAQEVTPSSAVGRRTFLVKAAVVGTVAWAVPTIITMEPAAAAGLTSPPPAPPGVEVEVEGANVVDPARVATEPEVEVRGALAITGVPITTLAGAGAAAIAGGGALHHWSARTARAVPAQADPVAEPDPSVQPAT